MEITIETQPLQETEAIVILGQDGTDLTEAQARAATQSRFTGKVGESVLYRCFADGKHLIFIGFASESLSETERLRRAGAHLFSLLKNEKVSSASLSSSHLKNPGATQAFCEGLQLAGYRFDGLKTRKDEGAFQVERISLPDHPFAKKELDAAKILSEAVNFARHLGDLPANHLTPSGFCSLVKEAALGLNLEIEEWAAERLKKEKMTGLLTVSRGSSEEPRMLILRYHGAGDSVQPQALVGKGLTFDSGGLDLKPVKNMEDMRYDMCGAAGVVAATIAAARLALPVNLVTFAALAENMPGPAAAKPGDIYVTRSGLSVEVMNTDAEGRLVLADALCLASEENPSVIIDAATLTGAVSYALGNTHTAIFSRTPALVERLKLASHLTCERVWELPLAPEHEEDIKGQYADITNSPTTSGAGSATAAAFLAQFVPKEIPWAHLDIAGTAQHVGCRLPYAPKKGASGVMVRTLVEFLTAP